MHDEDRPRLYGFDPKYFKKKQEVIHLLKLPSRGLIYYKRTIINKHGTEELLKHAFTAFDEINRYLEYEIEADYLPIKLGIPEHSFGSFQSSHKLNEFDYASVAENLTKALECNSECNFDNSKSLDQLKDTLKQQQVEKINPIVIQIIFYYALLLDFMSDDYFKSFYSISASISRKCKPLRDYLCEFLLSYFKKKYRWQFKWVEKEKISHIEQLFSLEHFGILDLPEKPLNDEKIKRAICRDHYISITSRSPYPIMYAKLHSFKTEGGEYFRKKLYDHEKKYGPQDDDDTDNSYDDNRFIKQNYKLGRYPFALLEAIRAEIDALKLNGEGEFYFDHYAILEPPVMANPWRDEKSLKEYAATFIRLLKKLQEICRKTSNEDLVTTTKDPLASKVYHPTISRFPLDFLARKFLVSDPDKRITSWLRIMCTGSLEVRKFIKKHEVYLIPYIMGTPLCDSDSDLQAFKLIEKSLLKNRVPEGLKELSNVLEQVCTSENFANKNRLLGELMLILGENKWIEILNIWGAANPVPSELICNLGRANCEKLVKYFSMKTMRSKEFMSLIRIALNKKFNLIEQQYRNYSVESDPSQSKIYYSTSVIYLVKSPHWPTINLIVLQIIEISAQLSVKFARVKKIKTILEVFCMDEIYRLIDMKAISKIAALTKNGMQELGQQLDISIQKDSQLIEHFITRMREKNSYKYIDNYHQDKKSLLQWQSMRAIDDRMDIPTGTQDTDSVFSLPAMLP